MENTNWNFWVSLITAIVAVIALWQTHRQVKVSNKQQLFNQRLENYLIVKGLIELFLKCKRWFDEEQSGEPELTIDMEFVWITNNTYLECITPAIKNILNQERQRILLIKLEDMEMVATKIDFLFSGRNAALLSDFVRSYKQLLFIMYQYQMLIYRFVLMKDNDHNKTCVYDWRNLSLKERAEDVNENKYHKELYDAKNRLKKSYENIKNNGVLSRIEKQIKLVK